MLAFGVLVYDGLLEAVAWGGYVRGAFTVSLVKLSCWRYQPRGVSGTLPWRVSRRRLGSQMVVGVGGGCSG